VEKGEGNRLNGKPHLRLGNNIKINLKEGSCSIMDRIQVA
jgi:hypothetical protein